MKIDDLIDLLDSNQIENKFDKLIAERIIEAERDWIVSITDLREFIIILEKEIGNEVTKENLELLLLKYNKKGVLNNSWKVESVSYLLDIFEWTGYSNLKLVFESLSNRLISIQKTPKIEIIEKKGFPTIKLYENHFEIKAIDYWEFRGFKYSELKELKLVNPKNNWWYRLYIATSWAGRVFAGDDPIKLKVIKKNNGDWEYQTSSKYNLEFRKVIMEINNRIKNTIANAV
ncbi:hypothetical protein A9Q86_10070 [Flavobacteriales bacterium 33_180_T64]|nr:hypothetical protein A9Q86_10070 [Flavobacteriales bacterium 33_180_T64]